VSESGHLLAPIGTLAAPLTSVGVPKSPGSAPGHYGRAPVDPRGEPHEAFAHLSPSAMILAS
jgi:hypothetical protein